MKEILLAQNKIALVDDKHYERLSQYKWYYHAGYAVRRGGSVRMTSEILQTHEKVDHKNHDRLDNRECNLRSCNHSQNMHNSVKHCKTSSKYKGVYFFKRDKKWQAALTFKNVLGQTCHIGLGNFVVEEHAALAYDEAAREHFKEFAALNFPKEGEQSCLNQE